MSAGPHSPDSWVAPDDGHNRAMTALVHPKGWVQKAAARYDLVAVGGGTAGLVASGGAAFLGARSAMIERALLGGDCLVSGCVPSKALIHAARIAHDARHANAWGIDVPEVNVDFANVMARLRAVRADIAHDDSAEAFKARGVDVLFGNAVFTGPRMLELDGQSIAFKRAVVCTGARPRRPDFPGAEHVLVSDDVFTLTELPARILVIGGGPIGCELAQSLQRLGSEVTLVERGTRLLEADDPEASEIIAAQLQREGVQIEFNADVTSVAVAAEGLVITRTHAGDPRTSVADTVIAAIGRVPNLEGLGLAEAGVQTGRGGIAVDHLQRTSNRRIYATGDCAIGPKFTHAAYAQSEYAVLNALLPVRMNVAERPLPWATYTDPEVAHVGPRHQDLAHFKGLQVHTVTFGHNDRARIDGESEGFARVHCKRNGQIVAATIVCRGAGALISELSLAMTTKTGLRGIGDTIHPYPTRSDYVRKLGDAYNLARVGEGTRTWLRRWFALLR